MEASAAEMALLSELKMVPPSKPWESDSWLANADGELNPKYFLKLKKQNATEQKMAKVHDVGAPINNCKQLKAGKFILPIGLLGDVGGAVERMIANQEEVAELMGEEPRAMAEGNHVQWFG